MWPGFCKHILCLCTIYLGFETNTWTFQHTFLDFYSYNFDLVTYFLTLQYLLGLFKFIPKHCNLYLDFATGIPGLFSDIQGLCTTDLNFATYSWTLQHMYTWTTQSISGLGNINLNLTTFTWTLQQVPRLRNNPGLSNKYKSWTREHFFTIVYHNTTGLCEVYVKRKGYETIQWNLTLVYFKG